MSRNNKSLLVIKAGGSILDDEVLVASLCADLKTLMETGCNIVLVHGGSKAINEALSQHGIVSEFVDGLRVTSLEAVKIIETVLCGQVNQLLVRHLNRIGVSTIGLSGAEHNMLPCEYYSKQHGFVGEIITVNTAVIHHCLSFDNAASGTLPVIATIGVDKNGNALNINADLAASHIANALGVDQLIFLTDQDGIHDGQGKLLERLTEHDLQNLINQSIVSGGMYVKTKAILNSLNAGLNSVRVLNGKQKHILPDVLLGEKKLGTRCNMNR